MSQSFIKKPDNGPHSALAGLGVLRSELPKPFARLHDDGHWTMEPGTEPYKSRFAGWSADVYSTEQVRGAFDVLRSIVAWRDNVNAGRVVRGAELEALIEEGRRALGAAYGKTYGTGNHTQLPAGYEVWARDVQPSDDPGAWTCKACGFRGFWRGGPHCGPSGVNPVDGAQR